MWGVLIFKNGVGWPDFKKWGGGGADFFFMGCVGGEGILIFLIGVGGGLDLGTHSL